jgi:hypothetical protein
MEQRVLRLGDLVDDYCPRERRVTDHVIVALVDDAIRQTRCAACESEHEYKEARMPRKKLKQDDAPSLAGGVLVVPKPAPANGHADDVVASPPNAMAASSPAQASDEAAAGTEPSTAGAEDGNHDGDAPGAWIGHRPLIRATLPKTENDVPPPRAIPEFTMHQRQGRSFGGRPFRHHGFGGGGGSNNGNGSGREADGNRSPGPGGSGGPGGPGGGGGKGRHRRRHRRPR